MKNYNFYNGNIFATILDEEREIEHLRFLEREEEEEEEDIYSKTNPAQIIEKKNRKEVTNVDLFSI